MNTKVEKYLNGEMTPEERAEFERRLADEPELAAALQEERAFLERLKTQMLREKIAAAATDPPKQNLYAKWTALLGLLLLASAAFWFFRKKEPVEQKVRPTEPPAEIQHKPAPADTVPAPTERTPQQPGSADRPGRPIAGTSAAKQETGQPGVRGGTAAIEKPDSILRAVWVTRFDPSPEKWGPRLAPAAQLLNDKQYADAYVQLQLLERLWPETDTLYFLKGYCLLEMREGAAALQQFERLSVDHPWKEDVEWYRVLGLLLERDSNQAKALALEIAKGAHPFRQQAEQLIQQLQ